jgi:hypothetical protein
MVFQANNLFLLSYEQNQSLIPNVPGSTWLDWNVLLYIIAKVIGLCD